MFWLGHIMAEIAFQKKPEILSLTVRKPKVEMNPNDVKWLRPKYSMQYPIWVFFCDIPWVWNAHYEWAFFLCVAIIWGGGSWTIDCPYWVGVEYNGGWNYLLIGTPSLRPKLVSGESQIRFHQPFFLQCRPYGKKIQSSGPKTLARFWMGWDGNMWYVPIRMDWCQNVAAQKLWTLNNGKQYKIPNWME